MSRRFALVLCLSLVAFMAVGCGPILEIAGISKLFEDNSTPDNQPPSITVQVIGNGAVAGTLTNDPLITIEFVSSERVRQDSFHVEKFARNGQPHNFRLDTENQDGGLTEGQQQETGAEGALVSIYVKQVDTRQWIIRFCDPNDRDDCSFLEDGLYTFQLSARDFSNEIDEDGGTGNLEKTATLSWSIDTQAPPVPPDARVLSVDSRGVRLAWGAVADPDGGRQVEYLVRAELQNADVALAGAFDSSFEDAGNGGNGGSEFSGFGFLGDNALSDEDDIYNGLTVVFTDGVLAGQSRRIVDYTGSNRAFVFGEPFNGIGEKDDRFKIVLQDITPVAEHFMALQPCRTYDLSILARDQLENVSVASFIGTVRAPCGGTGEFDEQSLLLFDAAGPSFSVPTFGDPVGVVPLDFNRDSRMDIAVLDRTDGVRVYRNEGVKDGTLTRAGKSIQLTSVGFTLADAQAVGGSPVQMLSADLNRDGIADLVVLDAVPSEGLAVLLGDGTGFGAPLKVDIAALPSGFTGLLTSLGLTDYNSDGSIDAVVGGADGIVLVTLAFTTGPDAVSGTETNTPRMPNAAAVRALTIADVNNDSVPDLIASSGDAQELVIFPGIGNSDGFDDRDAFLSVVRPGSGPGAVAVGDFDAERIADLAVVSPNPGFGVGALRILQGADDALLEIGEVAETDGDKQVTLRHTGVVDTTGRSGTVKVSRVDATVDTTDARGTVSTSANTGVVDVSASSGSVDDSAFHGTVDTSANEGTVDKTGNEVSTVRASEGTLSLTRRTGNVETGARETAATIPGSREFVVENAVTGDEAGEMAVAPTFEGTVSSASAEDTFTIAADGGFSLSDVSVDMYLRWKSGGANTAGTERKIATYASGTGALTLAADGDGSETTPGSGDALYISFRDKFIGSGGALLTSSGTVYDGFTLVFTGGPNSGEELAVSTYDSGTGEFTFASEFSSVPEDGAFVLVSKSKLVGAAGGSLNTTSADAYKGQTLTFTGGANDTKARVITGYDEVNRIFEFASAFANLPTAGDSFKIEPLSKSFFIAADGASSTLDASDDFYNGMYVRFQGATGIGGETVKVVGYNSDTKRIDLASALSAIPAAAADFEIVERTKVPFDSGNLGITPAAEMFVRFLSGGLTGESREIVSVGGGEITVKAPGFSLPPEVDDEFVVEGKRAFEGENIAATISGTDTTLRVRFVSGALNGQSRLVTFSGSGDFVLAGGESDLSAPPKKGDSFVIETLTEFDAASTSQLGLSTDGVFTNYTVQFTSGVLSTEGDFTISGFTAATRTFAISGSGFPVGKYPASTDTFRIVRKTMFLAPQSDETLAESSTAYDGMTLRFTTGANVGDGAIAIDSYAPATRLFTLGAALSAFPGGSDKFIIEDPDSFVGDSGLSDQDDFYNGMTLVMAVGGASSEILDYDGPTRTFTFADDFDPVPAANAAFAILSVNKFNGAADLPLKSPVFAGMDVRFLSGTLSGESAEIDSYDGATKTFTLASDLSGFPADGDSFAIELPTVFNGNASLSQEDDAYKDLKVQFASDTTTTALQGESFVITRYHGSTRTFEISGNTDQTVDGDTFTIIEDNKLVGNADLSSADDFYNDMVLEITLDDGGTPKVESQLVIDYDGASRTFEFAGNFTVPVFGGEAFELKSKSRFDGNAGLSADDDVYAGKILRFFGGGNANPDGEALEIAGYAGATRTFTFASDFTAFPAEGDDFEILDTTALVATGTGLSDVDGHYNGMALTFTSGDNDTESRNITAYDATTHTFTLASAFAGPLAGGDSFTIGSRRRFDGNGGLSAEDDAYTGLFVNFPSIPAGPFAVSAYRGATRTFEFGSDLPDPLALGEEFEILSDTAVDGSVGFSNADDFYAGRTIRITPGGGGGFQEAIVDSYDGATRTFHLDRILGAVPEGGDAIVVLSLFEFDARDEDFASTENLAGKKVRFSNTTATPGLQGNVYPIKDYIGTTRTFTFDSATPLDAFPAAGDRFEIITNDAVTALSGLSGVDNFYLGASVQFVDIVDPAREALLQGEKRTVSSYDGDTSTFQFATGFPIEPVKGDRFLIELSNRGNNRGDMQYARTQLFSPGKEPVSLVTGDFNDDGALDILVAHTRVVNGSAALGSVNGAAGTSAVTFAGDSRLSTEDGAYTGMRLRFDDDTATDTIAGEARTVVSYVGATRSFNFGASGFTNAPINGDSFLILSPVSGDEIGAVSLFTGNKTDGKPNGTFAGPISALGRSVTDATSVTVFRGDTTLSTADDYYVGKRVRFIDGALAGAARVVSKYSGKTRTFEVSTPFEALPSGEFVIETGLTRFVAQGDFNADRIPDLATAYTAHTKDGHSVLAGVSLLIGAGSSAANPNGALNQNNTYDQVFTGRPADVLARDIDEDGRLDLAVLVNAGAAGGATGVSVMLREEEELDGRARFAPPSVFSIPDVLGSLIGRRLAVGEFTRDGVPDLVVGGEAGADGFVAILEADANARQPTGAFDARDPTKTPVVVGDLVAGDFGLRYIGSEREPAGAAATDVVVAGANAPFPAAKAGTDGLFHLYGDPRDGAPTVDFMENPGRLDANENSVIALGDFNEDGQQDLVAARPDGTLRVHLGRGLTRTDGQTAFGPASAPVTIGDDPSAIAVGYFDGDAHLDVAVADSDDDVVYILLGKGDGTFTFTLATDQVAVGRVPVGLALGDLNGDGALDFVTANNGDGTVSVRLGVKADPNDRHGDGKFLPSTGVSALPEYDSGDGSAADRHPIRVLIADFNGDGANDVVVANEGTALTGGSVRVLFAINDKTPIRDK